MNTNENKYIHLLMDVMFRPEDTFRLGMYLDWLEGEACVTDGDLYWDLRQISSWIRRAMIGCEEGELGDLIQKMPNQIKDSFAILRAYASTRHAGCFGELQALAENFVPGCEAYTDDSFDPEHSIVQRIITECGQLDQYHSVMIHGLMAKLKRAHLSGSEEMVSHEEYVALLQQVLAIAKALPRYRGHARI